MKLSPFYRLDKIVTPTLVLGGDKDVNVPLLGGEQLYQGLKRLGRDTELIVYPGEYHGIRRPSFQADRYSATSRGIRNTSSRRPGRRGSSR